MPIEIKELVIRAVVHQQADQADEDEAAKPEAFATGSGVEPAEREAIVAAAVKEVLRILKTSRER